MESQDFDAWKIDLPGGGFIQKPGSELRPVSDEFASAEVSMKRAGYWLFDGEKERVFLAHNKCFLIILY